MCVTSQVNGIIRCSRFRWNLATKHVRFWSHEWTRKIETMHRRLLLFSNIFCGHHNILQLGSHINDAYHFHSPYWYWVPNVKAYIMRILLLILMTNKTLRDCYLNNTIDAHTHSQPVAEQNKQFLKKRMNWLKKLARKTWKEIAKPVSDCALWYCEL